MEVFENHGKNYYLKYGQPPKTKKENGSYIKHKFIANPYSASV